MIERQITGCNPEPLAPEETARSREGHEKALAHVDWLLRTLRPLLIDQFVHGYKHGLADRCNVCEVPGASDL